MATEPTDLPDLSATTATEAETGTTRTSAATNTQATNTGSSSPTQTATGSDLSNVSDTSSASVITGAPSLSSDGPLLLPTGLPTLSGYYSYPPPTVPPTANAPYMQSTQLPQNFVFIVVGACLAFVALLIILWRFVAAWSINHNFKRDASMASYTPLSDVKKKKQTTENSHDMADLSAKLPKSFNSVPNLFFSPTAEVARQSMIRPTSQHMPAGHYRDASR